MRKLICTDSFGNKIYPGDTVELSIPWEMRTTWKSPVYWNMLDGAFVDAHPGHVKMKLGVHRNLREFLGRGPMRVINEEDKIETLTPYCKKIKNGKSK